MKTLTFLTTLLLLATINPVKSIRLEHFKNNLLLFKALLLFFILFNGVNLNAQTLEWAKRMGGNGTDRGNSIAIDNAGNIYTTGYFYGTADFDPGSQTFNLTSVGADDIFISKLDASGNFVYLPKIYKEQ